MPTKKLTALIVDDEPFMCQLAADCLANTEGLSTLQASSGQEAINLFETEGDNIDFVIMDICMPGMDGIAAFRELIKLKGTTRALFVSGYSDDSTLAELRGEFPDQVCFLAKPYKPALLHSAIETLLGP